MTSALPNAGRYPDSRIQRNLHRVGATGLETPFNSSRKQGLAPQRAAKSGAVGARPAVQDPDLAEIIRSWPKLPSTIQDAVLMLVQGVAGGQEHRGSNG